MIKFICNHKSLLLAVAALLSMIAALSVDLYRVNIYHIFDHFEIEGYLFWLSPFIICTLGYIRNKGRTVGDPLFFAIGTMVGLFVPQIFNRMAVSPSFLRAILQSTTLTVMYVAVIIAVALCLITEETPAVNICCAAGMVYWAGVAVFSLHLFYDVLPDTLLYSLAFCLLLGSFLTSVKEYASSLGHEQYDPTHYKESESSLGSAIEVYAYRQLAGEDAEKALRYTVFYKAMEALDYETLLNKHLFGNEFILAFATDIHRYLTDGKYVLGFFMTDKERDFINVLKAIIHSTTQKEFEQEVFKLIMLVGMNRRPHLGSLIDISSHTRKPFDRLSNFAEHPFELDGVSIQSMEGFLQSLKFRSKKKQQRVCALVGKDAKKAGRFSWRWKIMKHLYWNGRRVDRFSNEYQELLTRAYATMADANEDFRNILFHTKGHPLAHSIGKDIRDETVLTEQEFIEQLILLREFLLVTE